MLITAYNKGKSGILKGDELSLLARKNTIDFRRRIRMDNINVVRKKIELLKKKEGELITQEALKLYKRVHQILGEEYSLELSVGATKGNFLSLFSSHITNKLSALS